MLNSLPIRIVIADDHPVFRSGLRGLLESESSFSIVGECVDGLEAIRLTQELKPDVLLLDFAMPLVDGLGVLRAIDGTPTHVVLLTAAIDPGDLLQAIQLGARGVVLKESAPGRIIEGIQRVVNGKYLIGSEVVDDLANAVRRTTAPRAPTPLLTPRELEIVSAIVAGEANRDIAARLSISLQTVKHHLTSIFDKTGVSTRLELALYAIRQGIVDEG